MTNIHDTKPEKSERLMALGIRPLYPSVFWDYDTYDVDGNKREAYRRLERYALFRCPERYWAIYGTKHGFHLIVRCLTWDEAQERLYELKKLTGGSSIMNCRKQRIRVGPKFKESDGSVMSPAPVLLDTNCSHQDLREGSREIYFTYDTGLDTNSERLLERSPTGSASEKSSKGGDLK